MSGQRDFFDDDAKANVKAPVAVRGSATRLTPAQRAFNRLTERIRRAREQLAAWEAFGERLPRRLVEELQPLERETEAARRRLVEALDAVLARGPAKGQALSRRHREAARSFLLDLAAGLLDEEPDAALEALHDRYSRVPYAAMRRMELEHARTVLDDVLGPEAAAKHEASSADELLERAAKELREEAAARAEAAARRRSRTGRTSPQKQQAAHEASLSVRGLYRKLASALHPDREPDPAERERKTALLQRANGAYERNDLLELLSLQMEIEQIDAQGLANLPEERLRHYNHVLQEQAIALEARLAEHAASLAMAVGATEPMRTVEDADRGLNATLAEAREDLDRLTQLASRLADPAARRAALEEIAQERAEAEALEGLAAIAFALGPMPSRRAPVRGRKEGGKKKKR